MHTYGFGKLFASCPTLEDALKLRITDTVCFDYSSGYQVWAGAWPRLGALPGFRERDWPIPPHAGTAGPRYSERGGRLAIWKRVMDRIIKHKPELAAVVGPWYTGIEVPEVEEVVPQPAPKAKAKTKKSKTG